MRRRLTVFLFFVYGKWSVPEIFQSELRDANDNICFESLGHTLAQRILHLAGSQTLAGKTHWIFIDFHTYMHTLTRRWCGSRQMVFRNVLFGCAESNSRKCKCSAQVVDGGIPWADGLRWLTLCTTVSSAYSWPTNAPSLLMGVRERECVRWGAITAYKRTISVPP